jgi:hypothetical protein
MLFIKRKLLYLIHHSPENPHNGDRANSSGQSYMLDIWTKGASGQNLSSTIWRSGFSKECSVWRRQLGLSFIIGLCICPTLLFTIWISSIQSLCSLTIRRSQRYFPPSLLIWRNLYTKIHEIRKFALFTDLAYHVYMFVSFLIFLSRILSLHIQAYCTITILIFEYTRMSFHHVKITKKCFSVTGRNGLREEISDF